MKYPQKGIESNTGAELVIFGLAASRARTGEGCAVGCGTRKYVAGEESIGVFASQPLGTQRLRV